MSNARGDAGAVSRPEGYICSSAVAVRRPSPAAAGGAPSIGSGPPLHLETSAIEMSTARGDAGAASRLEGHTCSPTVAVNRSLAAAAAAAAEGAPSIDRGPSLPDDPTSTVDHSSAYRLNSASRPESELGEDPNQTSGQQDTVPSVDEAMRSKLRRKHWAMFLAGNLISTAVMILETFQLIDGYVGLDSDVEGCIELRRESYDDVLLAQDAAIITLISGLICQIYFSTVQFLVCRLPLDTSIAAEVLFSRTTYFNVSCLSPFLWAWIYTVGGTASANLYGDPFCEWQGGSGIEWFLVLSGSAMMMVGAFLFMVPLINLYYSLGSNFSVVSIDYFRKCLGILVSSRGVLDLFWKLQAVAWVYRVSGFGWEISVLVGICNVVGVALTSIGSLAPDIPPTSLADGNTASFPSDVPLTPRESDLHA